MRSLVILALVLVGCSQATVNIYNDKSHGGRVNTHQDTARVSSSNQDASAALDVPVSVIPK